MIIIITIIMITAVIITTSTIINIITTIIIIVIIRFSSLRLSKPLVTPPHCHPRHSMCNCNTHGGVFERCKPGQSCHLYVRVIRHQMIVAQLITLIPLKKSATVISEPKPCHVFRLIGYNRIHETLLMYPTAYGCELLKY